MASNTAASPASSPARPRRYSMRLPGWMTRVCGTSPARINSRGASSEKPPPRSGSAASTAATVKVAYPTTTRSPMATPKDGKRRESIHTSPSAGTSGVTRLGPNGSSATRSTPRRG